MERLDLDRQFGSVANPLGAMTLYGSYPGGYVMGCRAYSCAVNTTVSVRRRRRLLSP